MISELDTAATILKEFLFYVGKSWWSKVLKKVIEAIYKEEIGVHNLRFFQLIQYRLKERNFDLQLLLPLEEKNY